MIPYLVAALGVPGLTLAYLLLRSVKLARDVPVSHDDDSVRLGYDHAGMVD